MALTVKDIVDLISKSQGFLLFVSFADKKPDGTVKIEHRYMRQVFSAEDLPAAFDNFSTMLGKDLADSGINLVKSAENIANAKFPNGESQ